MKRQLKKVSRWDQGEEAEGKGEIETTKGITHGKRKEKGEHFLVTNEKSCLRSGRWRKKNE